MIDKHPRVGQWVVSNITLRFRQAAVVFTPFTLFLLQIFLANSGLLWVAQKKTKPQTKHKDEELF